ncbi:zinc finger protein Gfi-1b-like [Dreissena polymorpha]|uniref:zinc finger protein Gfi-1b-like n=1 Tax=Dreissena polymorpha TaxID=45954 RepID=UPI002264BC89|nr:zinc finger protein Gfi-1b-like [Dreissena polymorpha]
MPRAFLVRKQKEYGFLHVNHMRRAQHERVEGTFIEHAIPEALLEMEKLRTDEVKHFDETVVQSRNSNDSELRSITESSSLEYSAFKAVTEKSPRGHSAFQNGQLMMLSSHCNYFDRIGHHTVDGHLTANSCTFYQDRLLAQGKMNTSVCPASYNNCYHCKAFYSSFDLRQREWSYIKFSNCISKNPYMFKYATHAPATNDLPHGSPFGPHVGSNKDRDFQSINRGFITQLSDTIELINGGYGFKNPLLAPNLEKDNAVREFVHCCKMCGQRFEGHRQLQRHLKSHSAVKRYLCIFCGKGFNDTFDLKRHTRTHTGVRPYTCEMCQKAFTQRCSLESHCRKIHDVEYHYGYKERRQKIHVCELCGHVTQDVNAHFRHINDSH